MRLTKTYSAPVIVVLAGLLLWLWSYGGIKGASREDSASIAGLGAGILGGGLVAASVVWTERLQEVHREALVLRQQIGLQSSLVGLDCSYKSLHKIYLAGKDLTYGQFVDADLTGATGFKVVLVAANLSGARLDNVRFSEAQLSEANLTGLASDCGSFVAARFDDALAIGATFKDCDFTNASFARCNASNAVFTNCRISKQQLTEFSVPPDVR